MNISNKVDKGVFWVDRMFYTNPSQTESESCSDHCNIRNMVNEEIPSTNLNQIESESCNDICNLVDKEISFIKKI